MKTETTEKVTDIIVTQFERAKEQVVPEANFQTDLGFDSLDQVEFIMAVEEAFDIEVPDEDAERITTVQQAIDNIERGRKIKAA